MAGPRGVALITGASSGFGALFADRFAGLGYDLVLVSRREGRLTALAERLASTHSVTAHVLAFDLAEAGAGPALHARLAAQGITVAALINNAGFGTTGPFVTEEPSRVENEIAVNVAALTSLSRAFLPDLLAAGDRGVLLNIASTAGYQPTPGMAVYGATKAYVRSLTEAIWQEHRGDQLKVLALGPGPSRTEFFDVAGSTDSAVGQMLLPEQIVDIAMKRLSRPRPGPSSVVGWRNLLNTVAVRIVPRRLSLAVAHRLVSGR